MIPGSNDQPAEQANLPCIEYQKFGMPLNPNQKQSRRLLDCLYNVVCIATHHSQAISQPVD